MFGVIVSSLYAIKSNEKKRLLLKGWGAGVREPSGSYQCKLTPCENTENPVCPLYVSICSLVHYYVVPAQIGTIEEKKLTTGEQINPK